LFHSISASTFTLCKKRIMTMRRFSVLNKFWFPLLWMRKKGNHHNFDVFHPNRYQLNSSLLVFFQTEFFIVDLECNFKFKLWFFWTLQASDVFAAMPPWQSWNQSSWNNWRDDKSKYQYNTDEALQYPEVQIPNNWKSTNTFYDENVTFGLQFRHV